MAQYGLSDGDCKQQVTDVHLDLISRSSCKQWRSLPSHLNLETIVAEDIDKIQIQIDERSKRHKFLLQWKDIAGSCATYKNLITALLIMKCAQDARQVCKILKAPRALASVDTDSSDMSDIAGKTMNMHCMHAG